MAGPCAGCSPLWNPPPTNEDKLVGAAATEGSGTLTPTLVVSRIPTPVPATAPAAASSLDNELFKQFIKAYLEGQVPGRTEVYSKPREKSLNAWFLDLL